MRDTCAIFLYGGISDSVGDFMIFSVEELLQDDLGNIIKARHLYIIFGEVFLSSDFCRVYFLRDNSFSGLVMVIDTQRWGGRRLGMKQLIVHRDLLQ